MRICEDDLAREIICIAKLEENKIIFAEIVLNTLSFRSDHRFRQGQIFKDARGRVDFSENIAVIWNNPNKTKGFIIPEVVRGVLLRDLLRSLEYSLGIIF